MTAQQHYTPGVYTENVMRGLIADNKHRQTMFSAVLESLRGQQQRTVCPDGRVFIATLKSIGCYIWVAVSDGAGKVPYDQGGLGDIVKTDELEAAVYRAASDVFHGGISIRRGHSAPDFQLYVDAVEEVGGSP